MAFFECVIYLYSFSVSVLRSLLTQYSNIGWINRLFSVVIFLQPLSHFFSFVQDLDFDSKSPFTIKRSLLQATLAGLFKDRDWLKTRFIREVSRILLPFAL